MDRRGFLKAFGLSAAAFVLDPEMLLWVPGRKSIFIPKMPEVKIYGLDEANKLAYWMIGYAASDAKKAGDFVDVVVDLNMSPFWVRHAQGWE